MITLIVVAPVAAATMPAPEPCLRLDAAADHTCTPSKMGDDHAPSPELVQKALVAAGYVQYDQMDGTSQFALLAGFWTAFPYPGTQNQCGKFWGLTTITEYDHDLATTADGGAGGPACGSLSTEVLC